jgi:Ca-activated chloride channel family protein
LTLVLPALGRTHRLRRHLPPTLLLVACTTLVLAIARPTATLTLVSNQRTIILVMDVSLSMASTDIAPSRFAAARAAAKAFVNEQPRHVRIGIVAFAGAAQVIQMPTSNRHELAEAIDTLQLSPETAIGSGMLAAISTLFPDVRIDDLMPDITTSREAHRGKRTVHLDSIPKAVPARSNPSAAMILLSDGASNTGRDPRAVAKMAAERGIRCFTVGFGINDEGSADDEGSVVVGFDEDTLRAIADITGAKYFNAATADGLHNVYRDVSAQIVSDRNNTEITALFAAAAVLFALVAAGLSLAWFNRPA